MRWSMHQLRETPRRAERWRTGAPRSSGPFTSCARAECGFWTRVGRARGPRGARDAADRLHPAEDAIRDPRALTDLCSEPVESGGRRCLWWPAPRVSPRRSACALIVRALPQWHAPCSGFDHALSCLHAQVREGGSIHARSSASLPDKPDARSRPRPHRGPPRVRRVVRGSLRRRLDDLRCGCHDPRWRDGRRQGQVRHRGHGRRASRLAGSRGSRGWASREMSPTSRRPGTGRRSRRAWRSSRSRRW